MSNEKVNVAARLYVLETSTGHRNSLDDFYFDLSRDQYERLQTSYQTKKLKYMNDDACLEDFCKLLFKEYGEEYLDLEDDQKLVVSYPIEITNGLSFDDLPKKTNGEQSTEEYYSTYNEG